MGYTVAVECRSKELRDEMIQLLDREWRSWAEVNGKGPDAPGHIRPPLTEDLSYHHGGPWYIGCDYNAGGPERHYLFAFIRWLALKVGKRTPFAKRPYYIYDGSEAMPVFVDVEHPGFATVDKWGVPYETPNSHKVKGIWEVTFELVKIYETPDALDTIRKEMQRLDELWEGR